MALSGHAIHACECLFWGWTRTWLSHRKMSAYDRGTLSYLPPPPLLRLMPLQRTLRSGREAKDKVASQRMVEKTFRFHRSLSNCRYEVLQTDTNCARRCIWDAVRAELTEAYCRREELSDYGC